MLGERDVRVPVGPDADRWTTVSGSKTILAFARTVTSTVRILDVLGDLVRGDFGVHVVFAVDDGSAFSDGVRDLLRSVGARIVPWSQIPRIKAHLAVTASENTDLGSVDAPILVIPHGVGFHKYVPDSHSPGVRLSGLVSDDVLRHHDVHIVVSHPGQVAQLERVSPGAGDRAVVVGDPAYERFLASVRLRAHYRRRMGVGDDRRLVVLTSTWRDQSLFGRWRTLPAQLLAALPADEYQVAAILHPNVWFGHSPWQLRTWLADARDAGLMLVPPTAGWQAAVIAADVLVGDHGSVTLYAAGLDVPLVLAAFGEEAVPGTPVTALARLAGRLDARRALRPQIEAAIAGHRPGQYRSIVDDTFAMVGQANQRLRQLLYDRLDRSPPAAPAPLRAWPPAQPEYRQPTSFAVYTDVADPATVVVRRYPAAVDPHPEEETETVLRHRAVYDDELDLRSVENASVIVRREATDEPAALAWARAELTRSPGALLAAAATRTGCAVRLSSGDDVLVTEPSEQDPMLLAAAVYARLRLGVPMTGEVRLRAGARETVLRLAAG